MKLNRITVYKKKEFLKIYSLFAVFSMLFDWGTTVFYFQHLPDFIEGNPFVLMVGIPVEFVILPTLLILSLFILLTYLYVKKIASGFFIIFILALPCYQLSAPLYNLLTYYIMNLLLLQIIHGVSFGVLTLAFLVYLVNFGLLKIEEVNNHV